MANDYMFYKGMRGEVFVDKMELCGILDEAADILRANAVGEETVQRKMLEQRKTVENFVANILVVGGFSAGKSAMLNAFLGEEEILPENINPETAVATEIVYGVEEKVVRVAQDGKQISCDFADLAGTNPEGFSKYVYVLNRSQLKDLHDLVLVDMPGFDSGIEAHNRALMQYIAEAAAYVFVIDLTKGTVGQSALDFLSEIREYSNSIAFVLTKADKMTPANIEAVQMGIGDTLCGVLGRKPELLVLSNREADAQAKIAALLRRFSPDELLMQKHGGKIALLLHQALGAMEVQLSAADFDSKDMDMAIVRQERKKEAVLQKMQSERKKLQEDLEINVPTKILRDVEEALRSNITLLTNSAKQGNESFVAAVNNILRPVFMQSTQQHIEATFDDYLGIINQFQEKQGVDIAGVSDKLFSAVNSVKVIAEKGQIFAKAQNFTKMYRVFSIGAALATNVIAPWLEFIIIFAPDILSVVNRFMERSKEEKLQNHIEREAIPRICESLRPEIRQALLRVEEEKSAEIESAFEATVDSEIQALTNLKEEKEQRGIDVEQKKESLERGIERLKTMLQMIEQNNVLQEA